MKEFRLFSIVAKSKSKKFQKTIELFAPTISTKSWAQLLLGIHNLDLEEKVLEKFAGSGIFVAKKTI